MSLRARIARIHGALPTTVGNARAQWSERALLLLVVDDGEGNVGVGEAAPLPGYSRDTLAEAETALAPWAAAPPALALDAPVDEVVAAALAALGDAGAISPSARAAVDVALVDLLARRRGQPAHVLLGATAPRPVPLAALLPMGTLADALAFVDGSPDIASFKAKIGRELDRELSLLEAVRRARPRLSLRLDANGTLPSASPLHRRIAALEPEYVEEPLPLSALLAAPTPLPYRVALDESLADEAATADVLRALDADRAQALVLKPGALGGLLRARSLAAAAAARGAPSSMSHLFDGPVARAAAAELALALARPAAAGLAAHPVLALFPDVPGPAFVGATIAPHAAPGLGIDLPPAATEHLP